MRNVVFRAKRVDAGQWVHGSYLAHKEYMECVGSGGPTPVRHLILYDGFADWNMPITIEYCEVDPATVGEFSGMYDKHGTPIYEGDIVRKRTYQGIKPCVVVFSCGCFHCGFGGGSSTASHPYLLDDKNIEVIGNVHDNPELLEGDR